MMTAIASGRISSFVRPLVYLCLLVVFLFSIRELSRHGPIHDYLFLFFGPLVSGAGVFFTGRRGAKWIPGFFGLYLVFYRGFWRLTDLSEGFSWVILFKVACFVFVGAVISVGVYLLSDAGGKGKGEPEKPGSE